MPSLSVNAAVSALGQAPLSQRCQTSQPGRGTGRADARSGFSAGSDATGVTAGGRGMSWDASNVSKHQRPGTSGQPATSVDELLRYRLESIAGKARALRARGGRIQRGPYPTLRDTPLKESLEGMAGEVTLEPALQAGLGSQPRKAADDVEDK